MKNIICLLALLLASYPVIAQESERGRLSLETDPLTTILGARTLSILYEPNTPKHWSLFTNVVAANFSPELEKMMNPNNNGKGFSQRISYGGGFAVDYFFKSEREGFYTGLIQLLFQNEVSKNGITKEVLTYNMIPRVGYRWFPFKRSHFYLNPFAGLRYESSLEGRPLIDDEKFDASGLAPFGTLHIGYHF